MDALDATMTYRYILQRHEATIFGTRIYSGPVIRGNERGRLRSKCGITFFFINTFDSIRSSNKLNSCNIGMTKYFNYFSIYSKLKRNVAWITSHSTPNFNLSFLFLSSLSTKTKVELCKKYLYKNVYSIIIIITIQLLNFPKHGITKKINNILRFLRIYETSKHD